MQICKNCEAVLLEGISKCPKCGKDFEIYEVLGAIKNRDFAAVELVLFRNNGVLIGFGLTSEKSIQGEAACAFLEDIILAQGQVWILIENSILKIQRENKVYIRFNLNEKDSEPLLKLLKLEGMYQNESLMLHGFDNNSYGFKMLISSMDGLEPDRDKPILSEIEAS